MLRIFAAGLLVLFTIGCTRYYKSERIPQEELVAVSEQVPEEDFVVVSGQAPQEELVAVEEIKEEKRDLAALVIFDTSCHGLPWNVRQELAQEIRKELVLHDKVPLVDEDTAFDSLLHTQYLSFDEAAEHCGEMFEGASYAVLVELIHHDILPTEREALSQTDQWYTKRCASTLSMRARLTILDLRTPDHEIALQETLSSNHYIPKEFEFWNYSKFSWNNASYCDTPICQAHQRLADLIVHRIESVVGEIQ
jgi:hypothetical protein